MMWAENIVKVTTCSVRAGEKVNLGRKRALSRATVFMNGANGSDQTLEIRNCMPFLYMQQFTPQRRYGSVKHWKTMQCHADLSLSRASVTRMLVDTP